MSDYNPFDGEPSPDIVVPADGGSDGDGQTTVAEPEYREYLDPTELADRYVRVKVDGEELEVPLQEALSGYSRTADYTRKTQELAAQRQQAEYALTLQRALETQPEETLRLLARRAGIELGQSPPPRQGWEQPSYDDGLDDEPTSLDPVQRRLDEQQAVISQLMEQREREQADRVLRTAISGLQSKYQADDATIREVIQTALQANMGPASFDMIYKNIAFDRAHTAREQAQQQRAQLEEQRRAAGERASQLIGSGSSANGAGGQHPELAAGRMSLSEAYEAALREHGAA
ncbi:MAG TPA: hypothetical protein VFX15_00265 [Actinomycetes bacterium]|nr:hypothetical protein [Actinomycetes bacterium]